MKFADWQEFKLLKESAEGTPVESNEQKNSAGGLDPKSEEETAKFKHADLITLPAGVRGTNCGNCKHFQGRGNGVGYCDHHDILQDVTDRMCCVYWDHEGIQRAWGDMGTHEE